MNFIITNSKDSFALSSHIYFKRLVYGRKLKLRGCPLWGRKNKKERLITIKRHYMLFINILSALWAVKRSYVLVVTSTIIIHAGEGKPTLSPRQELSRSHDQPRAFSSSGDTVLNLQHHFYIKLAQICRASAKRRPPSWGYWNPQHFALQVFEAVHLLHPEGSDNETAWPSSNAGH